MNVESNGEQSRAEFKTPLFSGSFSGKKMAEWISVLSMGGLIFVGTVLWQHKDEVKAGEQNMRQSLEKMSEQQSKAIERMAEAIKQEGDANREVQRQMVRVLREQSCLMALPEERREKEYFNPNSFCKR